MCIVLFTTAHPGYALILIDNCDEYILQPTSRPGWWRHPTSGDWVLSARDLQRSEQGTWLGITRRGILAVLTNFRERGADALAAAAPSRGRVVTAWLGGGLCDDGLGEGVRRLVRNGGVAAVGGFSMVAGRLRRRGGGVAVVSNRARHADDVPLVGLERGATWGLRNTAFDDPDEWPKVRRGKRLLGRAVAEAAVRGAGEPELLAALFAVLDSDTLPSRAPGTAFDDYLGQLKATIFVPAIGDDAQRRAMDAARADGAAPPPPNAAPDFATGMYGTQRQTVLLVDRDGRATLVERALWDARGNAVPRGEGDFVFRFDIDGWDE